MKLSPSLKKALSVIVAAVAGAAIVAAQKALIPLAPEATQAVLVALATGALHWLNTWGHGERIAQIANNAFVAGQGAAGEEK
jgi:hypothetical protein